MLTTACGSTAYVAPEILMCSPYSKAVDIWSLGVVLYVILAGAHPFQNSSGNERHLRVVSPLIEAGTFENILSGRYSMDAPVWKNISDSAKSLIGRILKVDPVQRPTAQQILDSEWFSS
jgi:serine/threonine protein kinase